MARAPAGAATYSQPTLLHRIRWGLRPRPKVDSRVVRPHVRPQAAVPDVQTAPVLRTVRARIRQRAKQLRNSLSAGLSCSKQEAEPWLTSSGIEPSRRAETLSLQEWGTLTKSVYGTA